MKFFGSNSTKPVRATEVREVPLGGYSEAAILLVLAGLYPQADINPQLALIVEPVVSTCRAELVRRWQKRGAPLAIALPVRLPAIIIEAGAELFRTMIENLTPQVDIARAAGPILAPTLDQLEGAVQIAAALLGALRESRIEIKVPEDLTAS